MPPGVPDTTRHTAIRGELTAAPDGLTTKQLAQRIGLTCEKVSQALEEMRGSVRMRQRTVRDPDANRSRRATKHTVWLLRPGP